MGKPTNPVYMSLQTARAAVVLPGAPNWDATPLELPCQEFDFATFYLTYTRAAAGGACDFALQISPYIADVAGVEDWFQQAILAGGAVVDGADSVSLTQREYMTYTATANGAENFVYGPVELRGAVQRIRVRCRESGAAGNPGTLHIVAVFA